MGKSIFDEAGLEKKEKELEEKSRQENLWDNPQKAEEIFSELKKVQKKIEGFGKIRGNFEAIDELLKSGESEENLEKEIKDVEKKLAEFELNLYFRGEHDEAAAIVSFHAGAGGTDAQDFTEMLLRMYLRFSEKKDWDVKIAEQTNGEEAGIKSATIEIKGDNAYGWLKNEHGVHRLVRKSPFNSGGTRETSFAMVEVIPLVKQNDLKINEEDLRVDVFRAGGHGGQSVNTTDSAVRITHLPTGITASCQNERSQLQNKKEAMNILEARLMRRMEEVQTKEISKIRGEKKEIAWGNQIRSYVLHPYKMVKDHRTNVEVGNVESVFDGEIDIFLKESLLKKDKAN